MTTTFGVIGSGWRCEFFLRLARAAPDRLRAAGVVTRSAARGEISVAIGESAKTGPDATMEREAWAR